MKLVVKKNFKGAALPFVILLFVIGVAFSMALYSISKTNYESAIYQEERIRAGYLADSGYELAMYMLHSKIEEGSDNDKYIIKVYEGNDVTGATGSKIFVNNYHLITWIGLETTEILQDTIEIDDEITGTKGRIEIKIYTEISKTWGTLKDNKNGSTEPMGYSEGAGTDTAEPMGHYSFTEIIRPLNDTYVHTKGIVQEPITKKEIIVDRIEKLSPSLIFGPNSTLIIKDVPEYLNSYTGEYEKVNK